MEIYELEKKIGYIFNNKKLLLQALSHRSIGILNNEKLEFLGDSILNFIITKNIYITFNDLNEGDMTYIRSSLVNSKFLTKIANKLNLNKYILLDNIDISIYKSINKNCYILSDLLEAIIGAIFIDGGIEFTEKFIIKLFNNKLKLIKKNNILKDFKTRLQEYVQKLHINLPEYKLVKIKQYKNIQKFYITCNIQFNNIISSNGIGLSKQEAEQSAAKKILKILLYDNKY